MPDTSNDSTPAKQPPTLEEMKAWLRDYRKQERLRRIAQGRAKPRTRRETEMFLDGLRKRGAGPSEDSDDA